jgi:UDP-N-acetyl-2-amino-2-deoxyglucuronate dehydrogenase
MIMESGGIMNRCFTIGVAGCGDIAGYIGLGARLSPFIRIAACADTDPEKARAFAKKNRVAGIYGDYYEMLCSENLDAVYLGVPHHLHHPMVIAAAERGVHVLCEKPVATTMDDALDICRMARAHGAKVGINYQYRYDRGCYALAQAARAGDMGELYYGCCNLPWHREGDYFTGSPWHGSMAASGGGTLITQASHLVDVLLWAMKGHPVAATGMTARRRFRNIEVEDLAMGIVELEGGGLISITSSMISVTERPVRIELYGSRGAAVYTGPEGPRVRFEGIRPARRRPPVWGMHALFRSMEGFRQWVVRDKPYLTPAEESLPVLAAIDAVYRSAVSGRREVVDQRYREFL